MHELTTLNV